MPDGTKPLPEPKLTSHQWSFVAFTQGQFHRKLSRHQFIKWVLRTTLVQLLPHLSGANEFKWYYRSLNSLRLSNAYMRQESKPPLVQIMACHLDGAKPLFEPLMVYCKIVPLGINFNEIWIGIIRFHSGKCIWKCRLWNGIHFFFGLIVLTHQGQVMHMSNSKLTIIGSDNGFSPGRHQAIIWTNACLLSIGPLGTSFSEILIEIRSFSLKKMHLNVSSTIWRQFCLGLNALRHSFVTIKC